MRKTHVLRNKYMNRNNENNVKDTILLKHTKHDKLCNNKTKTNFGVILYLIMVT